MFYTNYYICQCGTEWNNDSDCTCNDRCPKCRSETTPYASDSGMMSLDDIATERSQAISRNTILFKPITTTVLSELLDNMTHYNQAVGIRCPIDNKPVGHCNHHVIDMAAAKQMLDHLYDGPVVIYTFPDN